MPRRPRKAGLRGPGLSQTSGLSDQLDLVDFDTFGALSGRKADTLLGAQQGQPGPPKRAGMAINVPSAIVGHYKTEALLIVEEFDPAVDHRAAWTGIPAAGTARLVAAKPVTTAAKPVGAPEAITETIIPTVTLPSAVAVTAAAKSIPSAETVAAAMPVSAGRPAPAETVAAGSISAGAWSLRWRGVCGAGVDAMDRDDLEPPRGILEIANHGCPLRNIRRPLRSQSGSMTKRVAAVFQCDEAVTLGGIEPFDRALHGCFCEGLRAAIFEVRHDIADVTCRPLSTHAIPCPATGSAAPLYHA